MSTKPPIAARIPRASPSTLLMGSLPALAACAQPPLRRCDPTDCRADAATPLRRPLRLALRKRVGEVRGLDLQLFRLLAREIRRRPASSDIPGQERAFARDRVERRRIVCQR